MAGYRLVTIVAAAGAAVQCAFAIYFNIVALAKYRTADFLEATSTKDFTTKGTCVEYITIDQLNSAGYQKALDSDTNGCSSERDIEKGKHLEMRRTLAVSVHGIYYAYYTAGIQNPTMRIVAESVITATVGGATATPPSVNFSVAYNALRMVAEQDMPTKNGCDSIYGMAGKNSITKLTATDYLMALQRGRLDDDGNQYTDWPLLDIPVTCNDVESSTETNTIDLDSALSLLHKEKLYAHCLAQFQFAASGTIPNGGTFGVPLVGERAGPSASFFYPNAHGFNSTSDYNTKARMFLGQRFGYCVWAYVPMLLATCYLCADAVVFFLAEATFPIVSESAKGQANGQNAFLYKSLVIAATSKTSRRVRLSFGIAAVIASWLFYGLFVIWPWGFIETRMGRPVCETSDPDHVQVTQIGGWRGTVGGWKADWDASWYEFATLLTQVFVLLLLPFTTTDVFAICNRTGDGGRARVANTSQDDDEQDGDSEDNDKSVFVKPSEAYNLTMKWFISFLLFGAVGLIAGQAVSGARFGMAWAEGVVGLTTYTDETTGEVTKAFNEVTLAEQVYDQTIATLTVTIVIGFLLGAALQRHLLSSDVGNLSTKLLFAWLALVIVFSLPLLIYTSVRSIFSKDEANKDCGTFPDTGYDFSKGACEARFWSFLIGGGCVLLTILLITGLWLLEALVNASVVPKKVKVFLGEIPAFRRRQGVLLGAFYANKHGLGGFRSANEDFFNYETSVCGGDSGESSLLLYAPRITFSLPEARGARAHR